ncbi:hypothetical protein HZB69_03150 [Candidatus Amesbacteria bacterium]|nr:hypothetical protein [Candidatus Amesbacteria bacterium]
MSFANKEIVGLADELIIENHVSGDHLYDWIDIVGITQRPEKLKKSLYFTTHSDGTDGWHNAFDRRPMAQNVARDKGWHLAVEPGVNVDNHEHFIVSSLIGLSERLYEFARTRSNPYVIGVTGSVGKTTTVAFLEHLIRESGVGVTRFWSKRLTPLLVQCHYINRVDTNTPFIVMEYSAYGKDHVSELAKVLPPNLAFFTNIYEMHVGQDLFKSEREVCRRGKI